MQVGNGVANSLSTPLAILLKPLAKDTPVTHLHIEPLQLNHNTLLCKNAGPALPSATFERPFHKLACVHFPQKKGSRESVSSSLFLYFIERLPALFIRMTERGLALNMFSCKRPYHIYVLWIEVFHGWPTY